MLGFGTEPVSKPFWSVWQNTMDSRISMETQKVCQAASQTGRRRKGVRVLEPKIPSFLAKNLCVPTIHTQPGWTQLIINAKCLPQSLLVRLQNEDEAGVVLHPGQYEAFFFLKAKRLARVVFCAQRNATFFQEPRQAYRRGWIHGTIPLRTRIPAVSRVVRYERCCGVFLSPCCFMAF